MKLHDLRPNEGAKKKRKRVEADAADAVAKREERVKAPTQDDLMKEAKSGTP